MPDTEPTGSVTLTPPRALAVAALFGALGGWLVVIIADALDKPPPLVPWPTPIAVLLVAALVGMLAGAPRQRLPGRDLDADTDG